MLNRIIVEYNGKLLVVKENEIFYAFSNGAAVFLITTTGNLYSKYSLKELDAKLSKGNFIRTHRSYIVNVNYVEEIKPLMNSTLILKLKDKNNSEIPVSRYHTKKVREMFNKSK